MKKLIMTLGCFFVVLSLSGCNTIQGFGEDMSAGGKAISKGSENVKEKM